MRRMPIGDEVSVILMESSISAHRPPLAGMLVRSGEIWLRTGYHHPTFLLREPHLHRAVGRDFRVHSPYLDDLAVAVLTAGVDRLLSRRAPAARPELDVTIIGKPNLNPARRRHDIDKRLQARRDGLLPLFSRVALALLQPDLVRDIRHDLADIPSGALFEEGGAEDGLPGLLGVRIRVDGAVSGRVEEPDGLSFGVDRAGKWVEGAKVGGDVLGQRDVEGRAETGKSAFDGLKTLVGAGSTLTTGFLKELPGAVEGLFHFQSTSFYKRIDVKTGEGLLSASCQLGWKERTTIITRECLQDPHYGRGGRNEEEYMYT